MYDVKINDGILESDIWSVCFRGWYTLAAGPYRDEPDPDQCLLEQFRTIFGFDATFRRNGNSEFKLSGYDFDSVIFETEEDATLFFMTIDAKLSELLNRDS